MTNTLPKPVLVALLYRLVVLHFASQILPTIGADSWESEHGDDDGWSVRPVSTSMVLTVDIADPLIDLEVDAFTVDLSPSHLHHSIFTPTS